jgi:hypothetical protein
MFGDAGDDLLDAQAADDADDVLVGGAGNDTLIGVSGVDFDSVDQPRARYDLDGGPSGVTIDLAAGTAIDSFGDTDTLVDIAAVRGTLLADAITGSAADERFGMIGGGDTLIGGGGDDIASYAFATAPIAVNLAAGTVSVLFPGNPQTDTIAGILVVEGTAFDDSFIGESGGTVSGEIDDVFAGLDGADSYPGLCMRVGGPSPSL